MRTVEQGRGAFTLVEMLAVIAIVGILSALLLPALCRTEAKARRVRCLANLHETGLGFESFMHDHDGFPMEVSTNSGGTLETIGASDPSGHGFNLCYANFQALSNDVATPLIFACPSDPRRATAFDFSSLNNRNLSYFVGLNADYSQPNSILAGDRNLAGAAFASSSAMVRLHSGVPMNWTRELHGYRGNQLFADGHVERANGPLRLAEHDAPAVMDLLLPSVKTTFRWPAALASVDADLLRLATFKIREHP